MWQVSCCRQRRHQSGVEVDKRLLNLGGKHLGVLEQGGFVVSEKVGRVRTYTVEPKALDAMEAWVARRRKMLNAQFDRLEIYLANQAKKSPR